MHKENELDYLIAVYGVIFFALSETGIVDPATAIPKKLRKKDQTEKNTDSIFIYTWLSEKIRGISREELQKRIKKYNNIIESIEDNFFLNQFLMALFMLDHYIEAHASGLDKNLLGPKIRRTINHMRDKIVEVNIEHDGKEIILDSSRGASNIWRLFNGEAQLTKEVREARVKMWKRMAQNKPKSKESVLDKYKF